MYTQTDECTITYKTTGQKEGKSWWSEVSNENKGVTLHTNKGKVSPLESINIS